MCLGLGLVVHTLCITEYFHTLLVYHRSRFSTIGLIKSQLHKRVPFFQIFIKFFPRTSQMISRRSFNNGAVLPFRASRFSILNKPTALVRVFGNCSSYFAALSLSLSLSISLSISLSLPITRTGSLSLSLSLSLSYYEFLFGFPIQELQIE